MARLLSLQAAAKRAGMSRDRFRAIVRAGKGPACFNPLEGRAMYVDTVVDRWLESRDDRAQQGAA